MSTIQDRRAGVLLGAAFGDALGAPAEFMKYRQIIDRYGVGGRRLDIRGPRSGRVTDDTQMSLAVAHAILGAGSPTPDEAAQRFAYWFVAWLEDPASFDGTRAPGNTCTTAVRSLERSGPDGWKLWQRHSVPGSKGNGANMRVAPLALRTDWSWDDMTGMAQLQAAMTHGHPTAIAATDLTAVAVRLVLEGHGLDDSLVEDLLSYAYSQRMRYRFGWLGHVWDTWSGTTPSPQSFIERGWSECIDALLSIHHKRRAQRRYGDPCMVGGEGWVAEEALATALHVALMFRDDPAAGLRRAAATNGDSDSIATIAGALLGAAHGVGVWPAAWVENIEYRRELVELGRLLGRAADR